MICSDCGAEYSDTVLCCPYCGKENEKEAERIKQEKLRQLEQEAAQIHTLPQKRLTASTKRLIKAGLLVAAGILILVLISFAVSQIKSAMEYRMDAEQMETLQEYYENRDYEGLLKYVDEKEIYRSKFDKYTGAADVYDEYLWSAEQIDEYNEMTEKQFWLEKNLEEKKALGADTIFYLTKGLARACVSCKEHIADYGEFDDVEPYEELEGMCRGLLSERLLYTEAEIEELYMLIDNPKGISFLKRLMEKREANRRLREAILAKSKEAYINHMLNRTLIMFGVLFFIAIAGSFIIEASISGMHFYNSKARIEEMQKYYDAGEYTKLEAYMSDRQLYGQDNYEFSRIALLSYRYDDFLMERNACMEAIRKNEIPEEEMLCEVIDCASEVLYPNIPAYPEVHEEDRRISEEQRAVVYDFLEGILGFDKTEMDSLEQGMSYGRLEDEVCTALGQRAFLYLKEQMSIEEGGAEQ